MTTNKKALRKKKLKIKDLKCFFFLKKKIV
uniref:Uncharacterized protein n=1 Tax=Rhizophora mucronata TaxID=61149 RepID=A0A2P2J260_RHIMU